MSKNISNNNYIDTLKGRLYKDNLQDWKIYHDMYLNDMSIQQLKELLGIDRKTILRYFTKHNLKILTKEESFARARQKGKETCLKKYGVDSASKLTETKQKTVNTYLEKYGTTHPLKKEEVLKKQQITNLKKYKTSCSLNNKKVKDKANKTLIARYGTNIPMQNEDIKNKLKETCLEKYGVDNIFKLKKSKDNLRNYFKKQQQSGILDRLTKNNLQLIDEYKGTREYINGKFVEYILYNVKCNICNSRFEAILHSLPKCPKCHPNKFGDSQNRVANFIQNYKLQILSNSRKVIHPYEIDIFLPELNIGIEYNGNIWHSIKFKEDINYHKNKTELALSKGVKLYHIWEHDNENIIESMISSILNKTENKYYARKLKIKKVESKERQIFFDTNHLHGDVKAKLAYGLYLEDELVSCISFRSHKEGIEIARFATKLYSQCVGGFSRLLKNSIPELKKLNYSKIITYCDRDWTPDYKDSVYYKNGFKFVKDTGCSLFYSDNRGNKYSRETFQKHKLKQLFPDSYDDSKTANEILAENNIHACYNSGNWKLELDI